MDQRIFLGWWIFITKAWKAHHLEKKTLIPRLCACAGQTKMSVKSRVGKSRSASCYWKLLINGAGHFDQSRANAPFFPKVVIT